MQRFGKATAGVLVAMDNFSDKWLRYITRAFCYLTGRSNFALARGAVIIGYILMALDALWSQVSEPGPMNAFILVLVMPWWAWLTVRRHRLFKEIEKSLDKAGETIQFNVNPVEFHSFAYDRLFLNPMFLLFMLPSLVTLNPWSIGFNLFISSHYWVMHFTPGGKSVVRRFAEAAKKAASRVAEKARDLVPQPAPSPVPVPIGV